MSLKVEWLAKKTDYIEVISFFEIWNLYNRRNVMGRVYSYSNQYENNIDVTEYYSVPLMMSGGVRIIY